MSAAADDVFADYRPLDWPFWNTEASDSVDSVHSVDPVDPLVKEQFGEMAKFYIEAARRLPIADMPYLATSLSQRGLAIGLCDPVTNILLTTLYGFALEKEDFPNLVLEASEEDALKQTGDKLTFVDAIHRSLLGLIHFMLCYFRYLTSEEAKRCLTIAGHNLPLAVLLVEKACGSSRGQPDPDSATTKAALEQAYESAWCSNPQSLVRLMTLKYEPRVVASIKQVLCDSTEQLTKQQVSEICRLLLQTCSQQPTIPVPTTRTFQDSNGQVNTVTITPSTRTSHVNTVPLSIDLTKAIVGLSCLPSISNWFLRMSLLESVHELYIKALAQLPMNELHRSHLIRGTLKAGHAYGPMVNPVANIIFNTIWFRVLFPFHQDDLPAANILDSQSLSRVESRSLDAIVALTCKSYSCSERKALSKLCRNRRELNLWSQDFGLVQRNIDDLLRAAKHPEVDAYAAFIKCLTLDVVRDMQGLLITDQVISDAVVNQLEEIIKRTAAFTDIAAGGHTPAPALSESTMEILSTRRTAYKIQQDYVRQKLEVLVGDYSLHEGQKYDVGIICGVASASYYNSTLCYHVNFLANMVPNGGTPTPTPMHKLFFAQFWNRIDPRIEDSKKPPICCVVQDYYEHFGRCNLCEITSSTILHPPFCGYFMSIEGTVFPSAESIREAETGMLDIDYMYFDAAKDDIESARIKPRWSAGVTIRPR